MVQWCKDLVLLQLWHRSQLQLRFDPWPGNFHMLWVQLKKKKTNKQKKTKKKKERKASVLCIVTGRRGRGQSWERTRLARYLLSPT